MESFFLEICRFCKQDMLMFLVAAASIDIYISNSKDDRIRLRLVQRLIRDRCYIQKLSLFSIIFRFLFYLQFQVKLFILPQVRSFFSFHYQFVVLLLIESYHFYYLYQVRLSALIYLLNLYYLTLHLHFNLYFFK